MFAYTYLKRIYPHLIPVLKIPIKRIPYSWIAGKNYRKILSLCSKVDTLPRQAVVSLQEKLLGETLKYAVAEVPYYKPYSRIVDKYEPFDAIKEFPLLTKNDIQENWEKLLPISIRKIPHHEGTTGGSSGNQLTFLEDDATYEKEMAFMHAQWGRVGYTTKCRKATFRGVQFAKITKNIFWQENPIHNELQFSPFHMSEDNLMLYYEKLKLYKPLFIHGYPSAIEVLAEYVMRHKLAKLHTIKAILLGSEACSNAQRSRIENAFGKPVYTWYGQSERVVLGGECEASQGYHSFPHYGYLEIVKENGDAAMPGERGEIVGTGFLNRSMPLIRYQTDDTAIMLEGLCCCGRAWDLFGDVVGRWGTEFIYGSSGEHISSAAINMHGDLFKNAIRIQYYQEAKGEVLIRIVPNEFFSEEDGTRIIQAHNRKFWGTLKIKIKLEKSIPLTKSGKQRRIICNVQGEN